jgi:hypothetical protein
MNSPTASFSTCCKKAKISLPVQYNNIGYPEFWAHLLTEVDERESKTIPLATISLTRFD